ncbi:MAG: GTPase Era [Bryobacterales bacterium]|nr:GTPase Era [Bryobacterales bacterium]
MSELCDPSATKAGFVTILGKPNVGKSTLLNALVGAKVSITSRRAQTTRDAIQGVLSEARGQIVFVDSPGVHDPAKQLGKRMMREVGRAAQGCHAALLLVDASMGVNPSDERALAVAKGLGAPLLLLANKVDKLHRREDLLPFLDLCRKLHEFEEFIPISATKRINLDKVLAALFKALPESPRFYPEGYLTDQPEKFFAAELIRERILRETHDELPHSVAVQVDLWDETSPQLGIFATVIVERKGQKAILLGKNGQKMKELASKARQSLEARLDRRVRLEVFVEVRKNWRNNNGFVQDLDFRRILGQG